MISKEGILHQQVCDYIRIQHPTVIFRTDFAAGVKMTFGQAARHKRLQSGRAYPDIFIAEQHYSKEDKEMYGGLFLELKASNIYKKDGSLLSNPHVQEQADMLQRLRDKGYRAEFAVGFEEAREIIDQYLGKELVVDHETASSF